MSAAPFADFIALAAASTPTTTFLPLTSVEFASISLETRSPAPLYHACLASGGSVTHMGHWHERSQHLRERRVVLKRELQGAERKVVQNYTVWAVSPESILMKITSTTPEWSQASKVTSIEYMLVTPAAKEARSPVIPQAIPDFPGEALLVFSVFDVAIDRTGLGAFIPSAYVRTTAVSSMAADRDIWAKHVAPLARLLSGQRELSSPHRRDIRTARHSVPSDDSQQHVYTAPMASPISDIDARSSDSDPEASALLSPAGVSARSCRGTMSGPIRSRITRERQSAAGPTSAAFDGASSISKPQVSAYSLRTLRSSGRGPRQIYESDEGLPGRSVLVSGTTKRNSERHRRQMQSAAVSTPAGVASSATVTSSAHVGEVRSRPVDFAAPARLGIGPTPYASSIDSAPMRLVATAADPLAPQTVLTESISVASILRGIWKKPSDASPSSGPIQQPSALTGPGGPKAGRVCSF
jgi:hypothetical protein